MAMMFFNSSYYCEAIVAGGAIPPLIELVENGSEAAKMKAVWALMGLAEMRRPLPMSVAVALATTIPALVTLADTGSAEAKTRAAYALTRIVQWGHEKRRHIQPLVKLAQSVTPLVELANGINRSASALAVVVLHTIAASVDESEQLTAISSEAEDVYVAITAALGVEALAQLAREGTVMVKDAVFYNGASHAMREKAARLLQTLWTLRTLLRKKLGVALPELEIAIRSFL